MTCEHVKIGDAHAIICSRGPRRRKCSNGQCTQWASRECDYPVKAYGPAHARSHTCDKPLCHGCAVSVGPDRDYCPAHPREPAQMDLL